LCVLKEGTTFNLANIPACKLYSILEIVFLRMNNSVSGISSKSFCLYDAGGRLVPEDITRPVVSVFFENYSSQIFFFFKLRFISLGDLDILFRAFGFLIPKCYKFG